MFFIIAGLGPDQVVFSDYSLHRYQNYLNLMTNVWKVKKLWHQRLDWKCDQQFFVF